MTDGPEDDATDLTQLARGIADADADASRPREKRLQAQWNVPRGVKPYIPAWVGVAVLGSLAFVILLAVLGMVLN